jgi:glycosyltransferase involved in cell wall biosynthesis
MKVEVMVLASTYPRWIHDYEPAFIHELAKRLTRDFDVLVVCPHAGGAETRELMDGVSIHRYRYAPERLETLVSGGGIVSNLRRSPWKWLLLPGFILKQLMTVLLLIRRKRPDVIHAHWLIPQGLVAVLARLFLRCPPPVLITCHGSDLLTMGAAPLRRIKKWVARRATALTVVRASMCEVLEQYGADERNIRTCPMGVDLTERFTPDASVPRSDREILFVGRLLPKKGLHLLLAAMPVVLESLPDCSLTVAGFGPDEARLMELTRDLGIQESVRFLGAVEQQMLPELYRRAAVFVAPFDENEGLGLVLIEAIGCGCPVVVSDVPAARETASGLDAVIKVRPGDPKALADGIIRCILETDGGDERTIQAVREVRKRFDWSAVTDGYAGLLSGLIASDENGTAAD